MHRWTEHDLDAIAAALTAGGVVLLPTDTIYGLHGLATDAAAVAKIAAMKGRDADKPFVVLGATAAQLGEIGVAIAPELRKTLESIWPAPLTAVLPLSRPVAASRGATSLAVRVPALDWLRDLVARTGPLVSTSANRSGEPPVERPEQLAHELQDQLDGLVDAGPRAGEPSAIVDFTGDEPRFIREGSLSFTQNLRKTLRKSL
jgi:L-threonylcarbamoyladenylate synthase